MTAALSLDGVELSTSMRWAEQAEPWRAEQSFQRTLDGGGVLAMFQKETGRDITLVSGDTYGWLTYTQVQALLTRAEVVGAQYVLNINGASYAVAFRHHEPPALAAEPILARLEPMSDDYYRATIKLITV